MVEMCTLVDKSKLIPVDQWDTEENPIPNELRIFKNIRGEVIVPIAELFFNGDPRMQALNYFAMSTKRSYNSDVTRDHICKYLNYFEAYYDRDKELLAVLYQIKYNIDYQPLYSVESFMADVNRYIIRNWAISYKVSHFVDDNYLMHLSSNNNRTPNLQFNNEHAKILYEISLFMNMYIPLAAHYMYIHGIKQSNDIISFMLKLYDMCVIKYEQERNIFIHEKIYETAISVVNKSKNPDKQLWEKNQIRGNNTTTHTRDSVCDIVLQIMPKYTYDHNIINFNYYSNRQCLKFKITDIAYEYQLVKLSSSKRDADQNSEYDRYEARLNKKDEALALQNKVTAEQAVRKIEMMYGPFYMDEIEHYRRSLIRGGSSAITSFQEELISYLFDKDFGDPITFTAIHRLTDYIKLMIAAKRKLLTMGMPTMAYIISSKVTRVASRKVINKKDIQKIENDEIYEQIKTKYNNNPKVENKIMEIIGTIISSNFEIINWDENLGIPTPIDGTKLPLHAELVHHDVLHFVLYI